MPDRIAVAKILTTHGVKGAVRVLPLTDFPDRLYELDAVFLQTKNGITKNGVIEARVVEARPTKKGQWILRFADYDDISQVEEFRSALVLVDEADVAQLPHGHYYVYQLLGFSVYSDEGCLLGELTDILSTGANDVYVVSTTEFTASDILIPATHEVVKEIDTDNNRIVVHLLDGLIEK